MSYNAYQKTQQRTETPTEVEYRLFAQVTRALSEVADLPKGDPAVAKALDWNRRMWSTLSTDCSVQGNSLPKELRASIISLSMWVSRHSSAVMRGEEKVEDLIQVNKTIMEGLSLQMQNIRNAGNSAQASGETPTPQPQSQSQGQSSPTQAPNPILQNFKSTSV